MGRVDPGQRRLWVGRLPGTPRQRAQPPRPRAPAGFCHTCRRREGRPGVGAAAAETTAPSPRRAARAGGGGGGRRAAGPAHGAWPQRGRSQEAAETRAEPMSRAATEWAGLAAERRPREGSGAAEPARSEAEPGPARPQRAGSGDGVPSPRLRAPGPSCPGQCTPEWRRLDLGRPRRRLGPGHLLGAWMPGFFL